MKTLPREQANGLWQKWWSEVQNEWFKVEVLQDYYGEDAGPSLDYWLEGDKKRSINLIKAADYSKWVEDCRKKLEQGVRLIRIHIVEEPYSPISSGSLSIIST